MNLTAQQSAGIDKIKAWYDHQSRNQAYSPAFSSDPFRLFGYAGTGKTTMAIQIPEALGVRAVYGTFTGKAAHVLRRKGATPVSTIHSAIYLPTTSAEAKQALRDAQEDIRVLEEIQHESTQELTADEAADLARLQALIPELRANARRLTWELNPMCDWASADLIILDEVSMVNAKLASDIESLGVPIIVLGDPAQLPPVEGGGYYTDAQPDHLLTEIHRSALDNPITALATRVRESTNIGLGLTTEDLTPVSVRHAMQHDQVLVWSNKRRWALIKAIRNQLGYPEGIPVPGDRIMCLTNNRDLAVFNGQLFTVHGVEEGRLGPTLELETEDGAHVSIPCFADGFLGREQQDLAKRSGSGLKGRRMLATFAQAITVHKAQGSEWPSVYVVNETHAMMSMVRRDKGSAAAIEQGRQWLYTACTRAQENVTITAP